MFDVEKAIEEWQKILRKNEALEDGYIAELESHLREEIDNLIRKGASGEEAFKAAVRNIGQAEIIGGEYYKTNTRRLSGSPPWESRRFMPALLWNYFKIAFRKIRRQKGYSFINISGLAIGIACSLLIFIHLSDEVSYDNYHKNANRIYRVTYELTDSGKITRTAQTPAPLGPALLKDYPEVKNFVRFFTFDASVTYSQKTFNERLLFADESISEIFTFPFLRGNPDTALKEQNSIVITEEMAEKYFGQENPLGKILTVDTRQDFKVTGILKNIPRNSHFHFDFVIPFITLFTNRIRPIDLEHWGNIFYYTYILGKQGFSPAQLEKKLPEFVKKYIGGNFREFFKDNLDQVPSMYKFHLQPLTQIHLHSRLEDEMEPNSDIAYVYIFSTIALFILVIACINFMNLSTARSSSRAKEVGLRKVVGAHRGELIKQFLGESFILSFISLLLSIGLVELFLPVFNSLSGKELSLRYLGNGTTLMALIGILIFIAILSGSYPSFLLSAFKPVEVLKGRIMKDVAPASLLRTGLVIFQFTITIILVAGTIIIHNQMIFVQSKNLGFKKDHLIVVSDRTRRVISRFESFKNELLKNPDIIAVSASSGLPINVFGKCTTRPEGADYAEAILIPVMAVDYDFIDTYGIEVVAGRKFRKEFATDGRDAMIINEAAAKKFGWQDPVGKRLDVIANRKGTVVGVVKDFHISSLRETIEPLVFFIQPFFCRYASIRIRSQNVPATLGFIEKTWKKFDPSRPFEYSFLEDDINALYRAEQRLGEIFFYFTTLAIFVACLGLFGLTSFAVEQRTKEIGIRKVLGASVPNIISLLSRESLKWILVANLLAFPVAYYAMSQWLQNFAYRAGISFWIFLLAASLSLGISFLTVSFQVIKAALSNPVDSLRYE